MILLFFLVFSFKKDLEAASEEYKEEDSEEDFVFENPKKSATQIKEELFLQYNRALIIDKQSRKEVIAEFKQGLREQSHQGNLIVVFFLAFLYFLLTVVLISVQDHIQYGGWIIALRAFFTLLLGFVGFGLEKAFLSEGYKYAILAIFFAGNAFTFV
jgi:hypothetical protein